jgi:AMMECR1 domain-containing protein
MLDLYFKADTAKVPTYHMWREGVPCFGYWLRIDPNGEIRGCAGHTIDAQTLNMTFEQAQAWVMSQYVMEHGNEN